MDDRFREVATKVIQSTLDEASASGEVRREAVDELLRSGAGVDQLEALKAWAQQLDAWPAEVFNGLITLRDNLIGVVPALREMDEFLGSHERLLLYGWALNESSDGEWLRLDPFRSEQVGNHASFSLVVDDEIAHRANDYAWFWGAYISALVSVALEEDVELPDNLELLAYFAELDQRNLFVLARGLGELGGSVRTRHRLGHDSHGVEKVLDRLRRMDEELRLRDKTMFRHQIAMQESLQEIDQKVATMADSVAAMEGLFVEAVMKFESRLRQAEVEALKAARDELVDEWLETHTGKVLAERQAEASDRVGGEVRWQRLQELTRQELLLVLDMWSRPERRTAATVLLTLAIERELAHALVRLGDRPDMVGNSLRNKLAGAAKSSDSRMNELGRELDCAGLIKTRDDVHHGRRVKEDEAERIFDCAFATEADEHGVLGRLAMILGERRAAG